MTDFVSRMPARPIVRQGLLLLAAVFVAGLALLPVSAQAQNHLNISANGYGGTQQVSLDLNKSMIVDLPADAKEVIVSQPGVASTLMRSKRRAIIQGATSGSTNIFFLDASGNPIAVIDVNVVASDTAAAVALTDALRRTIPGSSIRVESFGDRVVLSGDVESADDLTNALAIATQFVGSVDNVASVVNISGTQQVMLKVTVAEVSREAVKQFGINLGATIGSGGMTTSLISQQPLGGASNVITGNGIGAQIAVPGLTIDATLRALERRGAMRTLAEPTLTALSGQSAEFLAGGEFPVPSGIDNNVISFTFKQFGVNLNFTPIVRSNGLIELAVETSVSEPTTEGGFALNGITIPATRERRAKTSVELQAGSSLAIAGLIQDNVRQQINKLPGVGDIPILGALFRSRDFVRSQTELVIIVTPYLAEAGGQISLPTDDFHLSTDAEAIFLGRMEKMYSVGEDPNGIRGGYDGSVGFVLD